jgi:hypothetical protein
MKFLVGKPEGERLLGRCRHKWEDNIVLDLRERGWGGVDLFHLAQDWDQWWAVMNMVMILWVP